MKKIFSLDNLKKSLPWLIVLFGITIFIWGHFGSFKEDSVWPGVFTGLGSAMLSGGVFAVLLKTMQYMNVFKDELCEIIYEANFLKNRKDLYEIWERVSKVVFNDKFPKISKKIIKDVSSLYFPTDHVLYYDDFEQTLEIELLDEVEGIINVTQHSKFTVYPIEKSSSFKHETKNTLMFSKSRDEVEFKIIHYEVNGKAIEPTVTETTQKERLITKYSVDLSNEESYRFNTKIEKRYSFYVDKLIGVMKDYIINDFSLKVYIKGPIQINLISAGTFNKFEKRTFRDGTIIEFDYKGLIYPRQGYILLIGLKH